MTKIDELFARLRREGRKAFMPFVAVGDPDFDFTERVLAELIARGSSLCEVGIPYSDPIADGPVIQASYARALSAGASLDQALEMLARLSTRVAAPLATMASFAIIHRRGTTRFIDDAKRAGVSGAIVPDLPYGEADRLATECRAAEFNLIQLVAPTTPKDRALRIAEQSTGFLYYVSVTGITGERGALPQQLVDDLSELGEKTDLPICVGFGVSTPEHVKTLREVCDGVIVGSAIVRRIAAASAANREETIREIGDYAESLIRAL
jgi:tryptophan synthase alpha chain